MWSVVDSLTMTAMSRVFCILLSLAQTTGEPQHEVEQAVTEQQFDLPGVPAMESGSGPADHITPYRLQEVSLAQLRGMLEEHSYVPIPIRTLPALAEMLTQPLLPSGVTAPPEIREARYSAVLSDRTLTDGKLELELEPISPDRGISPLLMGQTNLRKLTIYRGETAATIGADEDRRLFLLNPEADAVHRGTWSAAGAVSGDFVTFRLELPPAITSRFELTTPGNVQVSSSNGLVLGPRAESERLLWTIFPNIASRLTLTCRTRRSAAPGSAFSLAGMTTVHAVTGDSLMSRWTMSLPSELQGRNVFSSALPTSARVIDVVLNDNQPVEWSTAQQDDLQTLRVQLADGQHPNAVAILAISAWTQSDRLPLPVLTPHSWERTSSQAVGPILIPVSQISLTVPPGIDLDGWTLDGVQERDVIAGPDNSRTFQLIRYGKHATATAHISPSIARILNAGVTLLEASGRLATARCYINVRCEESAVVELSWSVSAGWNMISARDFSSGRSLFFEYDAADRQQSEARLLVHLPEPLEPQTNRVFEIRLQQPDWPEGSQGQLPIRLTSETGEPQPEILVVMPSATQSMSSQPWWNRGSSILQPGQFTQRAAWFPLTILPPIASIHDLSSLPQEAADADAFHDPNRDVSSALVSYSATIERDQLRQLTQLVIPRRLVESDTINLLMFAESLPDSAVTAGNSLSWTVNGVDVSPLHVKSADADSGLLQWSLPVLQTRDGESDIMITCGIDGPTEDRFTAELPFPEGIETLRGEIQLNHPENVQMHVAGLAELSPTDDSQLSVAGHSRYFRVPENPQRLIILVEVAQASEPEEAVEARVFHLLRDDETAIIHDVMAFARVSRPGGRPSMQLALPSAVEPVAFVNGSRVQLIGSVQEPAIPLPESSQECEVVLIWSQRIPKLSLMTTDVSLSAVFLPEHPSQQSSHHLLVDPDLQLISPGVTWVATARIDVNALVQQRQHPGALLRPSVIPVFRSLSASSATRGFITRWQLASAMDWHHRTLATPTDGTLTLTVRVHSLLVRRTLQYAAILVTLTLIAALLPFTSRYQLLAASLTIVLACSRLLISSATIDAVVSGVFWGMAGGTVLALVLRWPRRSQLQMISRRAIVVLPMLMAVNPSAGAQERSSSTDLTLESAPAASLTEIIGPDNRSALPDVLVLPQGVAGADLAYMHPSLYRAWKSHQQQLMARTPQAVVTSLNVRVIADGADSVECVLSIDVAIFEKNREHRLVLPLQNSRLVECTVDGRRTLPSTGDQQDTILIPIAVSIPDESPDQLPSAETGRLAAWRIHQIEVRLRPRLTRHTGGVHFRLPVLPCPASTVTVDSPAGGVMRAFVKSGSGILSWTPRSGPLSLNSLPITDGLEIRLFTDEPSAAAPAQPRVNLLVICELSAGQQLLTCVCHCTDWNPLEQTVHVSIPAGYRLIAVSSAQAREVFWSVSEDRAEIQLNDLSASEFLLELKLLCEVPMEPQKHVIQIAELGQIDGVLPAATAFAAIRTTPEFSIQQPGTRVVRSLTAAEIPPAFAGWLRRSDSLHQIDSSARDVTFRLLPRTSYSEVRVAQSVEIRDNWIDWTYVADIETAILARFRHQLQIDPSIEITDVQVFAGEANRLDKRYRRGDRLMILLREGTSGLYRLTIRGRQQLNLTDSEIQLRCPQLLEIPILESSLTVMDQSQSGYLLADTGSAVPDRRLETEHVLAQGQPTRFQIVDETEPIVLRRRRLSPRDASLAVIRHPDRADVLLQVRPFPSVAETDRMSFSSNVVFLEPPRVMINSDLRNTVRTGNDFRWMSPAGRSGDATLTACWTVPLPAGEPFAAVESAISLPSFSFDLNWKQSLLADTRSVPGRSAQEWAAISPSSAEDARVPASGTAAVPRRRQDETAQWIRDAVRVFELQDSDAELRFRTVEIAEVASVEKVLLPAGASTLAADNAATLMPLVVAASVLLAAPHESAVAETSLMIFAPEPGTRLTIQVSPEIIVTDIISDQSTVRDQYGRGRIIVDLADAVTFLRIRWLSGRATGSMFVSELRLDPPEPANAVVHHLITVQTADTGASHARTSVGLLDETGFNRNLSDLLLEGLQHLTRNRPNTDQTGTLVEGLAITPSARESDSLSDPDISAEQVQQMMETLARHHIEFLDASAAAGQLSGPKSRPTMRRTWHVRVPAKATTPAVSTAASLSDSAWNTATPKTPADSKDNEPGFLPDDRHLVTIVIRRIPPLNALMPFFVSGIMLILALAARGNDPDADPAADASVVSDVSPDAITRVKTEDPALPRPQ